MKYCLVVCTHHGEEIQFPHYGEYEGGLCQSLAIFQSRSAQWAEVRRLPDGETLCRYARGYHVNGYPTMGYIQDLPPARVRIEETREWLDWMRERREKYGDY